MDSGCSNGHGRVVLLYYELCKKTWDGSPATESGFESTGIITEEVQTEEDSTTNESLQGPTSSNIEDADETDQNDISANDTDEAARNCGTINKRRELLDNKLSTYKHERMKWKLPVDTQLLSCAQDELALS